MQIFHGDFTGDGADDALAWVLSAGGRNADFLDMVLFRNETGRLVYYHSAADVFGSEPCKLVFVPGRITLTLTMPRPGEPPRCPTGPQDWTINMN